MNCIYMFEKLIMENTEAEAIIKPYESKGNGRTDWKSLRSNYECEGIYTNEHVMMCWAPVSTLIAHGTCANPSQLPQADEYELMNIW